MSNTSYSSCCNVSGSSGHLSENNLPTADRTPADINNINKYTDYSLMNLSTWRFVKAPQSPQMFCFCLLCLFALFVCFVWPPELKPAGKWRQTLSDPHITDRRTVESVTEVSKRMFKVQCQTAFHQRAQADVSVMHSLSFLLKTVSSYG